MHRNRLLYYQALAYELFWTSQFARHICANYHVDTLHDVHHEDIAWLLDNYDAVDPLGNDRYAFLTWSPQKRRVYETYVYLEGATRTRAGRCVVQTSYQSNKSKYILAVTPK